MKAPIVSRKHIIQHTQFTLASGVVRTDDDVHAVAPNAVNTAFEVVEGSVLKAVYVERWLNGDSSVEPGPSFVLIVEKSQSANVEPSFTNMTTLDNYENKKNILYTTQGILSSNTGNPTPVVRQWIKIPKSKQRFGLQDKLRVVIAAIGAETLNGCGLTIYKSYT